MNSIKATKTGRVRFACGTDLITWDDGSVSIPLVGMPHGIGVATDPIGREIDLEIVAALPWATAMTRKDAIKAIVRARAELRTYRGGERASRYPFPLTQRAAETLFRVPGRA